jgi:hypothetical protein
VGRKRRRQKLGTVVTAAPSMPPAPERSGPDEFHQREGCLESLLNLLGLAAFVLFVWWLAVSGTMDELLHAVPVLLVSAFTAVLWFVSASWNGAWGKAAKEVSSVAFAGTALVALGTIILSLMSDSSGPLLNLREAEYRLLKVYLHAREAVVTLAKWDLVIVLVLALLASRAGILTWYVTAKKWLSRIAVSLAVAASWGVVPLAGAYLEANGVKSAVMMDSNIGIEEYRIALVRLSYAEFEKEWLDAVRRDVERDSGAAREIREQLRAHAGKPFGPERTSEAIQVPRSAKTREFSREFPTTSRTIGTAAELDREIQLQRRLRDRSRDVEASASAAQKQTGVIMKSIVAEVVKVPDLSAFLAEEFLKRLLRTYAEEWLARLVAAPVDSLIERLRREGPRFVRAERDRLITVADRVRLEGPKPTTSKAIGTLPRPEKGEAPARGQKMPKRGPAK